MEMTTAGATTSCGDPCRSSGPLSGSLRGCGTPHSASNAATPSGSSTPSFASCARCSASYGTTDGPELLIFGDSAMFWTSRDDADRRHLAEVIRDEIDPELRLEALVGASYGAVIIMAFLSALRRCPGRPRVVIVPTSIVVTTAGWLAHPQWGYTKAADGLREAVEGGGRPTRLERPTDAEWEAYDRIPAPSLIKARRTMGELRLDHQRHSLDSLAAHRSSAPSHGLPQR